MPTPVTPGPPFSGSALSFLPGPPSRENYVFAIFFTCILSGLVLCTLIWTAKMKYLQDGNLWNVGSVFTKAEVSI